MGDSKDNSRSAKTSETKFEAFEKQLDGFIDLGSEEGESNTQGTNPEITSGILGASPHKEIGGAYSPNWNGAAGESGRGLQDKGNILGKNAGKMDPGALSGNPAASQGDSSLNPEKVTNALRSAFGKFINNTVTLGKQVVDNASTMMPNANPASHASPKSPSSIHSQLKGEKVSPKASDASAILDQAANTIGGFGRSIKSAGGNFFDHLSKSVFRKEDYGDSASLTNGAHNLSLMVFYSFPESEVSRSVKTLVRYHLTSDTRQPLILSHLNLSFSTTQEQGNAPVQYEKVEQALSASEAIAQENLAAVKQTPDGSKSNTGIVVVSEVYTAPSSDADKYAYTFYTLLRSSNGLGTTTYSNFSSTITVTDHLQSKISNDALEGSISNVIQFVRGEIIRWMNTEYIKSMGYTSHVAHSSKLDPALGAPSGALDHPASIDSGLSKPS